MNPRTLSMILAACISLLVISVVVRTELFVMQSLLPLFESQALVSPME